MKLRAFLLVCHAILIASCNTKTEIMENKKIRLKELYINLMVENVQSTLHYYESIGFATIQKLPAESPLWARVKKDNVFLMFQSTGSLQEEFPQLKPSSNGVPLTLWIQTENIENYYEQIKGKTKIIKPIGITEYNGATEFVVEDNNGFILHFSDLKL